MTKIFVYHLEEWEGYYIPRLKGVFAPDKNGEPTSEAWGLAINTNGWFYQIRRGDWTDGELPDVEDLEVLFETYETYTVWIVEGAGKPLTFTHKNAALIFYHNLVGAGLDCAMYKAQQGRDRPPPPPSQWEWLR